MEPNKSSNGKNPNSNPMKDCIFSVTTSKDALSYGINNKYIEEKRIDFKIKEITNLLREGKVVSALKALRKTFKKDDDYSCALPESLRKAEILKIKGILETKDIWKGLHAVCDYFILCGNKPNETMCKILALTSINENRYSIGQLACLILKGIGTTKDMKFANEVNSLLVNPNNEEIKQKIIDKFCLEDLIKEIKK